MWTFKGLAPAAVLAVLLDLATTPTPIKPVYGFLWWLNTDQKPFAAATPRSFFALGAGGSIIWICPEYDTVFVVRWLAGCEATNEFMGKVIGAMRWRLSPPGTARALSRIAGASRRAAACWPCAKDPDRHRAAFVLPRARARPVPRRAAGPPP